MERECLENFEKVFLGACCGIGLKKRGDGDPHVVFYFLVEDDGNWFVSQNGLSSFWVFDFNRVWSEAQSWMRENCDPDNDKDGSTWGYRETA
jgi:hypothetical protein